MACNVAVILPDNDIVGHLVDNNGLLESENENNIVNFIEFLLSKKFILNDH